MRMVLLLYFILSTVQFAIAQNDFEKVINTTTRSIKKDIRLEFSDKSGNTALLPISVIKGQNKSPVFAIVAGVHGYEYPPIIATQELMSEIDSKELNGTLIIIPMANTASFYTRTPYINPLDEKNLNNAFPGKVDGSITEQIAYFITTHIISISDVFLDIHGGDACEDLIPFVCYYNNLKKPDQTAQAKKLSERSGFKYVVSYPYTITSEEPAKYAFKQAVQDGKTALSMECGKLGNVQEENVQLIKKGVYNMLDTVEMYTNSTEALKHLTYCNQQTYVTANEKGIFYSDLKAGDKVIKGDIVGYTTDEFGSILEKYKAPMTGTILYKLATPPINKNETVMCISVCEEY
ncbi:M14 family metallopeptidase [Aquimarina sp. ERC-38]|uniref:M14 family metallopeptidase n=1 Tax=Aquimarina sp. ERC-38 TaxID=2949996 RepID=UPI00224523AB|nr:M14 family metallopeptidase [Aquimarina sp. ERC-38]UZO81333.1 M14 family metallopeptidase [Aquimarina sp. ERC-38]